MCHLKFVVKMAVLFPFVFDRSFLCVYMYQGVRFNPYFKMADIKIKVYISSKTHIGSFLVS